VLNIGRLAAGGEGYYLEAVASGVEDYYTGSGEAPGFWLTEAAAGLGLAGRVTPEDLRHVLAARHPRTGEDLPRTARRRVPGFDLAFRAPKSVSLLYGLGGDEATAAVVRDAHDQAVAAALGYLERQAGFARRGCNGAERVPVGGLVAAAFRHRTSRAGDPLLHTHVLVSNLGRCPDGQWRTLDARLLYSHAKTAGFLYQRRCATSSRGGSVSPGPRSATAPRRSPGSPVR
jgi:conjugative relaxase-like TrwC/TraI family protein